MRDFLRGLWLFWEITVNLGDDFFVIGSAMTSLYEHWDLYNVSRILGKVAKALIQYELYGFNDWVRDLF